MPYTPDAFFAPATSGSGWGGGSYASTVEWPPATGGSPNHCWAAHSGSNSGQAWLGGFDLSGAGPSATSGFRLWLTCFVDNTAGYNVTPRLFDAISGNELWAASSPTFVNWEVAQNRNNILVWDIPASAFSGNPPLDDLAIRFDMQNLHTGNNRFRINAARLSANPVSVPAETPPSLNGQVLAVYRAADLIDLNIEDDDQALVWPDGTGQGQHLVYWTDAPTWDDAAQGVRFVTDRMLMRLKERYSGDFALAARFETDAITGVQVLFSVGGEFNGAMGAPGDKNILVVPDNDRANGSVTIMSGDGSDGSHLNSGSGVLTAATPTWITQYVQDSGNERAWMNDAGSTIIDDASGSNNLYSLSVGDRENDERPWAGVLYELWLVDMTGLTTSDLDAARDWWVNGPSDPPDSTGIYRGDGTPLKAYLLTGDGLKELKRPLF